MTIEEFVNRERLSGVFLSRVAPVVVALLFGVSTYLALKVAPLERVMGEAQRIFYFHVGSAFACYGMIAVLFSASVLYLLSRKREWDLLGEAASSVGFLLCTIVLLSGMIWGHSAWNTWWRWEPRLVSFLVLWLVLLSNVVLRIALPREAKVGVFSAVLGIFSALNVPIVIFSIQLLAPTEQLHPQVIAKQGLGDPWMVRTLILATISMFGVSGVLLTAKLRNLLDKQF